MCVQHLFFSLLRWGLWLSRQSVIDIIKSVLISFVSCDNVVNGREQVRSCGKIIYTTKKGIERMKEGREHTRRITVSGG